MCSICCRMSASLAIETLCICACSELNRNSLLILPQRIPANISLLTLTSNPGIGALTCASLPRGLYLDTQPWPGVLTRFCTYSESPLCDHPCCSLPDTLSSSIILLSTQAAILVRKPSIPSQSAP